MGSRPIWEERRRLDSRFVLLFALLAVAPASGAPRKKKPTPTPPPTNAPSTPVVPAPALAEPAESPAQNVVTPTTPKETLTLAAAYAEALRYSPAIRVAAQNLELQDRTLRGTWAIIGPTVNVGVQGVAQPTLTQRYKQFDKDGNPLPDVLADTQKPLVVQGRGEVSQPLIRAELFPTRAAAREAVRSAEETMRRVKETLAYDLTSAFIGVMRTRQQMLLSKNALARAEQQLASTRARVKLGAALKTAELLAMLDVARAKQLLIAATGDSEQQEAIFLRLVGRAPPDGLKLPPTPLIDGGESLVDHIDKRGDVRALDLTRSSAFLTERALRMKILIPRLDILGSISAGAPTFNNYENPTYNYFTWNATLQLSIPLFQAGNEWVQARLQHVRGDIARAQYDLAVVQAGEDVRRALAKVRQTRTAEQTAIGQLEIAQQNYDLVSNQFKLGAVPFLDVANAQRALSDAEQLRLLAGFDKELAVYTALWSAGKLAL